ncbi:LPXTG cell wall anchor domain-containing protein [Microbacterium sp.]|uniref:LPXTG cell wall anchor domain-containing protein n=1 Tax=Microbacterium sp. TaxID=51671 RepID=UPI003736F845
MLRAVALSLVLIAAPGVAVADDDSYVPDVPPDEGVAGVCVEATPRVDATLPSDDGIGPAAAAGRVIVLGAVASVECAAPAGGGGELANTGSQVAAPALWGGVGALLAGGILAGLVRRRRVHPAT